ncbi:hypothetical protein BH10ACT2_BH10ACT2_21050 [soil metagenome]
MKRSWLVLIVVVIFAGLAGVAIAGRPAPVDQITVPPSSTSTTAVPATTSTTTVANSDSTQDLDRASVRVIVANGTDAAGVAADTALKLEAAGFANCEPVDALDVIATTNVYYRSGFKDAALAVAAELELDDLVVRPLSDELVSASDEGGDVIVALGTDFAH